MTQKHTVKAYDDDLKRLGTMVVQMGGMAESQFAAAIEALVKRDSDKASTVVQGDAKVDVLRNQLD